MASTRSELKEEIIELREDVQTYKPGCSVACPDRIKFPDNLYIGLFGRTGCGKTSLINSMKFAASGRLRRAKWLQVATQEKAGGHTMFRKLANMTESIFLVDNRGLDTPDTQQAISEIAAQLDGKRGYGERVEWDAVDDDGEVDGSMDFSDEDLNTGHNINCAVFVFSARHDIDTNTTGLTEVVDFLHCHQGRYPVAVITHVDVAEKAHVENLKMVLHVSGVSDVFEVANITNEKAMLEEEYQLSLLSLVERCMTDGDETIIFKHYQQKDKERKAELERKRREKELKKQEELRNAKEQERRAEEERQRQDDAWKDREERRRLEEERIQLDYQIRLEQERHKHEMEMERQRTASEEKEREAREREREQRFQEAMRKAETDKQLEIMRIMQANQKPAPENSCAVM